MLRRLYAWVLSLAASPRAMWALAALSFAESSVFPIPPDVLLLPMVLAAPYRAFRIAAVCTAASVLGGAFGYFIGWALFEQLGQPILGFYGLDARFEEFRATYNEYGAWAVLIAGLSPFPYKVITILSGATSLNIWIFMLASIVARGARFFIIAALLWRFGPPIRDFIERRLGLVFTLGLVALVAGFALIGFLR